MSIGEGERKAGDGRPEPNTARHLAGFVASGLLAFTVDAAVLTFGERMLGLDPRVARIAAISLAMIAGWLAHRRWTFAVATRPTLGELGRYAAAASMAAAVNYATFVAILTMAPAIPTLAGLVASTGVATLFSYIAMRYGVYAKT